MVGTERVRVSMPSGSLEVHSTPLPLYGGRGCRDESYHAFQTKITICSGPLECSAKEALLWGGLVQGVAHSLVASSRRVLSPAEALNNSKT